ncbi:thioesterase family protein [Actinoallomurus rhizosphaericola]|uniref:thioesterase family protein n=1 Tax=Actinoallomurus rhizosphaericola TaxID=2952536 RepID=UPI002093AFC9|nr:thioesterase family protein [Actinoallomurus rhizosphaericola]MCO5998921.1 thioesterase family protein [Actinoallomurus rhizosphaericola]
MHASLQPGLTARLDYLVPAERTVPHLLPESEHFAALPPVLATGYLVLATGYLVGIVEWTCMRALDGHLEDGEQTLGVHVDLSHQAPTPPGSTLTVHAELTAVDGGRLTFSVRAHDEAATVCQGTHHRAIIDAERFHARVRRRLPQ